MQSPLFQNYQEFQDGDSMGLFHTQGPVQLHWLHTYEVSLVVYSCGVSV